MKKTYLDIAIGARWLCQLVYMFNPLFVITDEEVRDYILSKKPSLKGVDFSYNFTNQRVFQR